MAEFEAPAFPACQTGFIKPCEALLLEVNSLWKSPNNPRNGLMNGNNIDAGQVKDIIKSSDHRLSVKTAATFSPTTQQNLCSTTAGLSV